MEVTADPLASPTTPLATQVAMEVTADPLAPPTSPSATQVAMDVEPTAALPGSPSASPPESSPTQVGIDPAAEHPSKRLRTTTGYTLPQGIRLCIIGGIRGSGKHTLSGLLSEDLTTIRVPNVVIDADSFLEPPAHCQICASIAEEHNSPRACGVGIVVTAPTVSMSNRYSTRLRVSRKPCFRHPSSP